MPSVKQDIQLKAVLTSTDYYTNDRTLSQDVASLFIPRRSNIAEKKSTGSIDGWYDHLYEPHGINAAEILSSGQYDILYTGRWFETRPPKINDRNHQRYQSYYAAGERMRDVLDLSNFKLEIQEFLDDRSTFHTSLMLIEEQEGDVVFTHIPKGSYAIAEDHNKYTDTVLRWFKLTAQQAAQKFQREGDKLPPKVQDAVNNVQRATEEFTFYHLIIPNYDRNPASERSADKPWSSRYWCEEDPDAYIRVAGYEEQPFVVSRFKRWGDSPYGTGPTHKELCRARSLQIMKRDMLAAGSLASRPRYFTLDRDEEIDPNEDTVVTMEEAQLGYPKPKIENHQFQIAKEEFEADKQGLDRSFHVPFFELFNSELERKREKTAYEASLMLEEKLRNTLSTFDRLELETNNVLLTRLFNIMLRRGDFNDLIDDMLVSDSAGNIVGVEEPEIVFTSKLANMRKVFENNAFQQWLTTNAAALELRPDVIDNFDLDTRARNTWKNLGLPADELFDEKAVEDIREQRAQVEQAALALQGGQAAAEIDKTLRT